MFAVIPAKTGRSCGHQPPHAAQGFVGHLLSRFGRELGVDVVLRMLSVMFRISGFGLARSFGLKLVGSTVLPLP